MRATYNRFPKAMMAASGLLAALALLMTVFAYIEARKPHPWSAPEKA